MFKITSRLAGLVMVLTGLSCGAALAQSAVYPAVGCVEYSTNPAATFYLAHFDYLSDFSTTQQYPLGANNSYSVPAMQVPGGPGTALVAFQPGYHKDANILEVPIASNETWTLDGTAVTISPYTAGATQTTATPGCKPKFRPANLTLGAPGLYTQQYLGQIDSAPADGSGVSLMAFPGSKGLTFTNLTYVANDSGEAGEFANPNSIYGDVTVTPGVSTTAPVLLVVMNNGIEIARGISSIAYTGTGAAPDATATSLTTTSSSLLLGSSATLTAAVADATTAATAVIGNVTLTDTLNGNTTTLGTFPLTNGQVIYNYAANLNGNHTLTATYTPAGAGVGLFTGSSGTLTMPIQVDLGHVWVLNGTGSLSEFGLDGSVVLSDGGLSATATAFGGLAIDASGTIWSVSSGVDRVQRYTVGETSVTAYSGGGLNTPGSIAMDGSGAAWITDGNGTISVFENSGSVATPSTGYKPLSGTPGGISVDSSGDVWITNQTAGTVVEVLGAAAPVLVPLAAGVTNGSAASKP